MSGGAYDYFFGKLQDFTTGLKVGKNKKRIALKSLLVKLVDVLHAVEWADSGDISQKEADKKIDNLFENLGLSKDHTYKSAVYDDIKEYFIGEE